MVMLRFYRETGPSGRKLRLLQQSCAHVRGLATELCFYVESSAPLSDADLRRLRWVLSPPFEPGRLGREPRLAETPSASWLVEIGPRLNFSTAFSSNAVSICAAVGIKHVTRLEVSTRYLVTWQEDGLTVSPSVKQQLVDVLHDRMTQCRYPAPLESFRLDVAPQPWYLVDVLGQGRKALEEANSHLGLAFDSWDLDYYTDLFRNKLRRNPTSVECFDLAQSNSEHSRHWFFKGKMIIDGIEEPESLIDMIIKTQETTNPNSIIKFCDNSSAIEGFVVPVFRPAAAGKCSEFSVVEGKQHLVFTAETHNFPTGVAPFSGATTGTGGRLRDVHAVGRGGHYIAGTAGYCVGNLFIPGYDLPWEQPAPYPANFAPPLEILVEASNGASDYGNKFGEPVVCGFARSFGLADASGERREWVKPVMFSGGVGCLDAGMVDKMAPEKGMQVVKLGGPVYRIGVGGGAASSVEVQGDNKSELDFGAVQRGDAEMEQKLHRVIRACLELGAGNPICSIHDQGAGGNGNVLKEIVEPLGAVVFARRFQLGDPTISTLELWGAEYQENDAVLCRPGDVPLLRRICGRERCPVNFVGTVLDCGKIILSEEEDTDDKSYLDGSYVRKDVVHPVNLELELVLGKMPQKEFRLERRPAIVAPLALPPGLAVRAALDRVLRLPAVASKRYLTSKVDRCVTGLVAQQQCVGPLHAPLADVAVAALSVLSTKGVATAIGEQPIKGLIDPAAGARLTVAESLSNLVFAAISDLKDVKCSGNWMWAAKLPGEGAALRDACAAMCRLMAQLGVAADGGKDSLSMAARVGGDVVKAPGTLVVSAYAPCPDVTKVVTPDLKGPSLGAEGVLLHVDPSGGRSRLGGSALAQCFGQLGDRAPDVDRPGALRDAFAATQELIRGGRILAGHDVSDGGLVTCLLEMAFGGISGLRAAVSWGTGAAPLEVLFSEEVGWVLEVLPRHAGEVRAAFRALGVPCSEIGRSIGYGLESLVTISVDGSEVLREDLLSLYKTWEETSYRLECLQADPDCARQEFEKLGERRAPEYALTFTPEETPVPRPRAQPAARVAVVREEGSNGDREMAVALHLAGFQVLDVTMQDLLDSSVTVDQFQGVVFPGGFSYADVLGSAKGWAASLLFHPSLRAQFRAFAARPDTFSLGVCNGCQLMSLLGWVGVQGPEDPSGGDEVRTPDVALDHNLSGRFECRFATVRIDKSPAVMLEGMEGSVMGVWVAHGEGRFTYRNEEVRSQMQRKNCFAIKYVDDAGNPTEVYPLNPNGSVGGVAGVCSPDGRHLAMMPHPERCTQLWQWPWLPPAWRGEGAHQASPWLRLFQNARAWASRSRADSS
ncbi:LOW QUALITY PROTEIN: phosphoribosylformylglycinamidine synthase [Bacillus rossius redtenbacheri]|uniref:LOW QUALITY PROTEIN: phosphoribosylformylglycinamidine synthase n=1 Tax=Bacillus rossius redtenbacheri TaxID=93214 RepID=UPI002FDCAAF1